MRARSATRPALLVLLAAFAAGEARPVSGGGRQEQEGDRLFRFRSETPAVETGSTPEGFVELRIPGYGSAEGAPGSPDLPIRTVLVAIPEDATPRLEVASVGGSERRPWLPSPVPRFEPDPAVRVADYPAGDERLWAPARRPPVRSLEADPRVYDRQETFPPRIAWLGDIGILREQRYVEVHIAPVRYDGTTGAVTIDREIEVTVHFDGARGAVSPRRFSRFEPVYRNTFLNYEQGRGFRLAEPEPQAAALAAPVPGGTLPPRRRIVVRENGVVRLDHALFLAQAPEFLSADPRRFTLTSRGEQVRLHVRQNAGNPALLEPGEWVQFYGQALDDEPKTVLNTDNGGNEDLYELRDFSDENVYFLTVEAGVQPEMSTRAAAPGVLTPPTYFNTTARAEVDDAFLPLGGEDPWFWLPVLFEADPQRTDVVALPGLSSGTAPASFRVRVRGLSACSGVNPDHRTLVSLKNALNQTLRLPASDPNNVNNENIGQFDGRTLFLHDFDWTHSGIQAQMTNPLQVLISVDDIVGCSNDVLLDWIEIDYRRSFAAVGDELTFTYPDGNADFAVSGLLGPATEVQAYEITNEIGASGVVDAVRLTSVSVTPDGPTFTARFRMDNDPGLADGTARRFVVIGSSGTSTPAAADFPPDRVSTLLDDPTPADLLVVAHPDLLDGVCSEGANPCAYDTDCTAGPTDRCEIDPASELGQFLAHRDGGGISSRVARIQDVYDEFNDGLASPQAIVSLVAWVYGGGWGPTPPSYLLLLGDASYDFKSGTTNGNLVPTILMLKNNPILGFYSADNLLAAVAGADSLPELVVGRISARTPAEADTVLSKVRLYEQAPVPGDWHGHAVLMSDRAADFGDFEAREFERMNEIADDLLHEAGGYTSENLRYWSDNCIVPPGSIGDPLCDRDVMRDAIQNAINGVSGPGCVLAQFIGHGNFELWSDDVLFCVNEDNPVCPDGDDMQTLTNGGKLPWLLAHNCLTGGFHSVKLRSIGEDWVKHAAGGAIAVLAPSGLGFRFLGEAVIEEIWPDLFGPEKERSIAVPVMDSLTRLCSTTGTPEGCQFYTLIGDPSMTLALPTLAPPTGVEAVGDNAVVHLSWTASPDAVSYDVYRTTNLNNHYVRVNPAPIVGTAHDDGSVVNGTTYYYYVVSVDADLFESPWSNQNTDCATLGLDCVSATPLNPFPPSAPTGLVAVDPETGGKIDLSWSGNPEADLKRYTVHYGPTPDLGASFDVLTTSASVTGLADGAPYYFAISATNTSNLTSSLSSLVSAVPTQVLGLKAPGFVADLMIGKSGATAVLTWGAITTDIYGKPIVTDHYEIFRGTSPEFVPDLGNRIGTSASATWLDTGALAEGEPDYHYLVRAVDGSGTAGGLGNQLPDGIRDLQVIPGVGNTLLLFWTPVTTDFDGSPTAITHYLLYTSDGPFSRADIRDGSVLPAGGAIPTASTVVPLPVDSRYYSVLAVDGRGNLSPF